MSCSWSMPRFEFLGHLPTAATVGAQDPGKQEQRGCQRFINQMPKLTCATCKHQMPSPVVIQRTDRH